MNELHGIDIYNIYNKKTKTKVKIHEINGWEKKFKMKLSLKKKSHKNSLTRTINEVEKHNLTYKIHI
jgi:hypothetical protein